MKKKLWFFFPPPILYGQLEILVNTFPLVAVLLQCYTYYNNLALTKGYSSGYRWLIL